MKQIVSPRENMAVMISVVFGLIQRRVKAAPRIATPIAHLSDISITDSMAFAGRLRASEIAQSQRTTPLDKVTTYCKAKSLRLQRFARSTGRPPMPSNSSALVCIIHERAAERGFEAFEAGCSWPWRSAGRRRRISSVVDRLGARVWLIPSTLLPGSGAASKRERIRGKELRGYPLKAPKAKAI